MTFKYFRRGKARSIAFLSAFVTILICLYYISTRQTSTTKQLKKAMSLICSSGKDELVEEKQFAESVGGNFNNPEWGQKCYVLNERETNITAIEEYSKFNFQPEWMSSKEYWDRGFEDRYKQQKTDKTRPPLKVIVVPHSHNDPGWLRTYVDYFEQDSRRVLDNVIKKMQVYKDMTFIWSEISFLQMWWDQAKPAKQRDLKRLINEGRFEITTGGWVMTDEANVHIYPMLDQLIEGHQWLRNNLNVTPTVGWSVDPFGQGSTVPYLLSGSHFEGAIIQRIHYAWKQWFALKQTGDFIWEPYWQQPQQLQQQAKSNSKHGQLLTHNMPFDIYSIRATCGPHQNICISFDFRKIPTEYTDYSVIAEFITEKNVQAKAQLLLDQYSRTASLFPHNVALIPLGDDFRYNYEIEVDQQYTNYKRLFNHIMANKKTYNVDIAFGTPRDYFREIRRRSAAFPTFKGDFFVYADVFTSGHPAYWSGYFTTRPFYKILSTDLEHNLRSAEILFTIAYNTARQFHHENNIKIFEKNYEKMILARRNMGLFQHHDAITGTSKEAVMCDYGMRLFESIQDVVKMQESAIEFLLQNGTSHYNFLFNELNRKKFDEMPLQMPITLETANDYDEPNVATDANSTSSGHNVNNTDPKTVSFVVFNSLAQQRLEIITIRSQQAKVKVLNSDGVEIKNLQINPIWNVSEGVHGRIRISTKQYELMFVALLEPLSLTTFMVVAETVKYKQALSSIYCDECTDTANTSTTNDVFLVKSKPTGNLQLENNHMRLLFDEKSGFLKTIARKASPNDQQMGPMRCGIKFAAYRSAQYHSGAYLFKPNSKETEAEKDVLDQYKNISIIITSGPIASDVTVMYGAFLTHTVRIYNTDTYLDAAIQIKNDIDLETPPKNIDTELFMRLLTDIENIAATSKATDGTPLNKNTTQLKLTEFYSDQNGFQYHKRIKVPEIGIEGNYYPITTGAFLQDSKVRLTLLTTHAQGAASYEPGQLEVMLDRRTLFDDKRGMGEGILDSRLTRHKFWLVIENRPHKKQNSYQVPSLLAMQLANGLRYPPNIYFMDTFESSVATAKQLKQKVLLLENGALPCDVHLMNFRTLSGEELTMFPSSSALIVLQRQGFDGTVGQNVELTTCSPDSHWENGLGNVQFNGLRMERLESTSLTGMQSEQERQRLRSFAAITLNPMDLKTFNVTFKA